MFFLEHLLLKICGPVCSLSFFVHWPSDGFPSSLDCLLVREALPFLTKGGTQMSHNSIH